MSDSLKYLDLEELSSVYEALSKTSIHKTFFMEMHEELNKRRLSGNRRELRDALIQQIESDLKKYKL